MKQHTIVGVKDIDKLICKIILFLLVLNCVSSQKHLRQDQSNGSYARGVSNMTLAGLATGCTHSTQVLTNSVVSFPMCIGQTSQDLVNGKAIIDVIKSRQYLPACRVIQLMLWMASEVSDQKRIPFKQIFVDIGANIGSCTVTIASLGLHVVSVEPVINHVQTILGSMAINPSFHIELHHAGVSHDTRIIQPIFFSGNRNWGATIVEEYVTEKRFAELQMKSVQNVVGHRDVSLMKIDCEGCEWAALKGARGVLHRTQMLKIELIAKSFKAGNETVSSQDILKFLKEKGFDLFYDLYDSSNYFEKKATYIMETDRMFGSKVFNLESNATALFGCARELIRNQVDIQSVRSEKPKYTDVIAIERKLADKMRLYFGV